MALEDAKYEQTANGSVWFSSAGPAAALAIADVQAWQNQMQNGATAMPKGVGDAAPIVSAVAGSFGAMGVWGNLGVGIANLVMRTMRDDKKKPASLQIGVTNQSSRVVALNKAVPQNADIANLIPPLASGESGVVVIVNDDGFSNGDNSKIELVFHVGGGLDAYTPNPASNNIYVELDFHYKTHEKVVVNVSPPGRWEVTAKIDSSEYYSYEVGQNTLQLCSGTFVGAAGSPYFSFYTSSIETGSGQIDIVFYDCACSPPTSVITSITSSSGAATVSGTATIEGVVVSAANTVTAVNIEVRDATSNALISMVDSNATTPSWVFSWNTQAMQNNNTPLYPNGTYNLSLVAFEGGKAISASPHVGVTVQN